MRCGSPICWDFKDPEDTKPSTLLFPLPTTVITPISSHKSLLDLNLFVVLICIG